MKGAMKLLMAVHFRSQDFKGDMEHLGKSVCVK